MHITGLLYVNKTTTRDVKMNSISFHATTKLESKLSGIYEILYKKESNIVGKINRYTDVQQGQTAQQALLLHSVLSSCTIAGLFYLLY